MVPLAGTAGWARFPVLPISAVVPFKVSGFTVASAEMGPVAFDIFGGAPPDTPVDALHALVQYALWWYRSEQTAPTLAPPIVAAPQVQSSYWTAPARPEGYRAVGDWRRFAVIEATWPFVPNQRPSNTSYEGEKPSQVYAALSQAVELKESIKVLLPQVSAELNSEAASARG